MDASSRMTKEGNIFVQRIVRVILQGITRRNLRFEFVLLENILLVIIVVGFGLPVPEFLAIVLGRIMSRVVLFDRADNDKIFHEPMTRIVNLSQFAALGDFRWITRVLRHAF